MNRLYFVRDERGERTLDDSDLPLTVGGADVANVLLPDAAVAAGDLIEVEITASEGYDVVGRVIDSRPAPLEV